MDDLVNGFTDRYLDNLDRQRDALDASEEGKLTKIKEMNDAGVLSDKDYADRQVAIQNYTQSEQEKIDEKQKKAERDAFLLRQAIALADIAISTAANIAKTPLLAPLYYALAGVQTAAVVAQSIPYFAEGGTMSHDGKAVVGDGGKHERVVFPNGQVYITPNEPTIIDMPKGTKIYPDAAKMNNEAISNMIMLNSVQNGTDMSEVIKHLDKLDKSILSLKQKPVKDDSLMKKIKFAKNYKLN